MTKEYLSKEKTLLIKMLQPKQVLKADIKQKSCIRQTLNFSTCADSSTDTKMNMHSQKGYNKLI